MRAALIVGARPNYMKAAPILAAAEGAGLELVLVHTGQHYDPALSSLLFGELGLPEPAHRLEVGRGRTPLEQVAELCTALPPILEAEGAEALIVVGDVTSTLAGSLVAAKARELPIPLAHVEAGLRSFDRRMPEELNRLVTDQLADLLLCSEPSGVRNLRAEGRPAEHVFFVGNTMIDTLLRLKQRAAEGPTLGEHGLEPRGYGLVTLHRPSNVDDPAHLQVLLDALAPAAQELPLVFPCHPRTRARLERLQVPAGVRLLEPQAYLAFLALMQGARFVLTDSGGIQEETTVLGVRCLTVRENTERPITVAQGTNRLLGIDPVAVGAAALGAANEGPLEPVTPPLWDGRAGERIAAALAGFGAGGLDEAHRRVAALGGDLTV
ncbi:MAG: UDP-N-acetylglucosamine 2-epimerase (non-hydrolyzing) [Planctomycetota bacterium]